MKKVLRFLLTIAPDVLGTVGVVLIACGAFAVSTALGFVVLGAVFLLCGALIAYIFGNKNGDA